MGDALQGLNREVSPPSALNVVPDLRPCKAGPFGADWKAKPRDKRGEEPQKPAPCERITCSDVTIEAVTDRLRDAPRGLIVTRDELAGWLGSFNQYKSRRGGDVGNWVEKHGGRPMLIDCKTGDSRTVYIPRASVYVCGGIQPGTQQRALTSDFYENGFCARTCSRIRPAGLSAGAKRKSTRKLRDRFSSTFAIQPRSSRAAELIQQRLA